MKPMTKHQYIELVGILADIVIVMSLFPVILQTCIFSDLASEWF